MPRLNLEAATAMLEGGMTPRQVASRFGVTPDAVYQAQYTGRLPRTTKSPPVMPSVASPATGGIQLVRDFADKFADLSEAVARM